MSAIISLIWDKTPKWVRWSLVAIFLIVYTPIRAREEALKFVDSRVWAVISPMKEKRDYEITIIQENLKELKEDVRDVKNYLLYKKRPEEDK